MNETDIHFAADHPTAAGHFPGNPIIPGAVLLDEVVCALQAETGFSASVIRAAKFLAPVLPGDVLRLIWQEMTPAIVKFECWRDATIVASGTAERSETLS